MKCPRCKGLGRIRDERAFGQRMQARRKRVGATLRQVARLMGKSVGYLSDLEHGRKRWRAALSMGYLDALDELRRAK